MADNIIIKITTEADLTAAQKQLNDMESAAYDLTKQMTDLKKAEAEEVKELEARKKAAKTALDAVKEYVAALEAQKKATDSDRQSLANAEKRLEDLNKELDNARTKYKNLTLAKKDEIKANKQSITEYNKQIKSYKQLQGEGGRMVLQLRAMREELQRMEDAGQFGTEAFNELAIAAAKLEDQIGDTQARIRVLSSDTLGLDTAMGVSDGLAGAFYVATSAAEVFGSDMEGLQQAFYKVQAAMSTLSGVQQVANALNKDSVAMVVLGTSMEKVRQKALQKSAAFERLMNIQKVAGVAADGAKTASTSLLTKAQWKLNAAMAANPLGVIIALIMAAVAAVAAFTVGIVKLAQAFSVAGKAQRNYNKLLKEFDKLARQSALNQAVVAQAIVNRSREVEEAYRGEINAAKARNASELELLEIEKRYADERASIYDERVPDALAEQTRKIALAQQMLTQAQTEYNNTPDNTRRKEKAYDRLQEAITRVADEQNRYYELEQQQTDATQAAFDAELALIQKRVELGEQLTQSQINLMQEGQEKELAQIRLNYRQKLEEINGLSEEEGALRESIIAEQAKEEAAVRRKYALEAAKVEIQEKKNLLKEMEQLGGTEQDYTKQLELRKEIAREEADYQIAELDRAAIGEKAYAAEVKKIRLELKDTLKQIDEQEFQRIQEQQEKLMELELKKAEAESRGLSSTDVINKQKAVWEKYYATREKQIRDTAHREIEAIKQSTRSEEEKAAEIALINQTLNDNLENNARERAAKMIAIDEIYISELQRAADKAGRDVDSGKAEGGKLNALKARLDAEKELYSAQQSQLDAQYEAGLITYQEYKDQEWEITKATADAEAQYVADKMQTIADGFSTALGYMQEISDMVFDALASNVQAQMDALDEMYTTDAEEAKESANKRYISEKELADKKAKLEMKAAKYAKAQALINAAINTASAIVTTLAQLGATPWGIAASVIAGAMGAAQIGIIASKPLAQYEKGRKGGKGEYALVGEKGPEIMYIPPGASIVPNHFLGEPAAWEKFGVPALPNDTLSAAMMLQAMNIDYDRLGKAVAANIPKQQAVSVNVDRSGVTIDTNGNRRTYLNHKYTGAWS
jgi:hypothetical protein